MSPCREVMKHRRILTGLLALLLLLPGGALAAVDSTVPALTYVERDDGTAEVTGLTTAADGLLEIPAEVDGHAVTAVSAGAFQGTSLSHVEVPAGVLSIGAQAFADCENLVFVSLPSTVTELGSSLFSGSALRSFTVPAGIRTVPAGTFSGCTELSSVVLPVSVTAIAQDAFSGCTSLGTVYYTGTKDEFAAISVAAGNEAFTGAAVSVASTEPAGFLYNIEGASLGDDLTVEIAGLADTEQTGPVVIPSVLDGYPVTSIGPNAFERCRGITEVELPDSLTSISQSAFQNCTALRTVSFPEELTEIGASAFQGCTALESASLPDSLTDTGQFAFAACSSLTTVLMPHGAETPGEYLFAYSGLTSFRVPRGWTSIPKGTFEGCSDLLSVTIPASIYSIGEEAFGACSRLQHVYLLGSSAEAESISIAGGNEPFKEAVKTVSNLVLQIETPAGSSARYVTGATATRFGTPASAILPVLRAETSDSAAIYTAGPQSTAVSDTAIVGTGMTARWTGPSGTDDAAQFILMGDVTGSGQLNIVQLVVMARALTDAAVLDGPYLAAGDWDSNGSLDIADLMREAELFLGSET